MKKHIYFYTEKGMNAANDCGKTMANLQKGINVRLINNAEDFFE